MITGARVFPNALRISNFLAVSDSPMTLDKERHRTLLERYVVEGKQVFNLSQTFDRSRLERCLTSARESAANRAAQTATHWRPEIPFSGGLRTLARSRMTTWGRSGTNVFA